MSEWQRCPVCEGRGVVPVNFYGDKSMSSSIEINERCRTCLNGLVVPPPTPAIAPAEPSQTDVAPLLKILDRIFQDGNVREVPITPQEAEIIAVALRSHADVPREEEDGRPRVKRVRRIRRALGSIHAALIPLHSGQTKEEFVRAIKEINAALTDIGDLDDASRELAALRARTQPQEPLR